MSYLKSPCREIWYISGSGVRRMATLEGWLALPPVKFRSPLHNFPERSRYFCSDDPAKIRTAPSSEKGATALGSEIEASAVWSECAGKRGSQVFFATNIIRTNPIPIDRPIPINAAASLFLFLLELPQSVTPQAFVSDPSCATKAPV